MVTNIVDIPLEHHHGLVAGRPLHWVTAGSAGPTVLLVHGFPETWWTFHRLIPLLATDHRIVAVDLPGFGGSIDPDALPGTDLGSTGAAETLHALIAHLDSGPVHLLGQDIAGNTVFRLATAHPEDVRSLVAVETLVSGHGLERLADVQHGGAWHVGAIATPGVAAFTFTGRMRAFLSGMWFPVTTRVAGAVTAEDIDTFAEAYEQPGAWDAPQAVYADALHAGEELRRVATASGLHVPVLAVDGNGTTTADGMRAVSEHVEAVRLDGVGHHVALEAPGPLADAVRSFVQRLDDAD